MQVFFHLNKHLHNSSIFAHNIADIELCDLFPSLRPPHTSWVDHCICQLFNRLWWCRFITPLRLYPSSQQSKQAVTQVRFTPESDLQLPRQQKHFL